MHHAIIKNNNKIQVILVNSRLHSVMEVNIYEAYTIYGNKNIDFNSIRDLTCNA